MLSGVRKCLHLSVSLRASMLALREICCQAFVSVYICRDKERSGERLGPCACPPWESSRHTGQAQGANLRVLRIAFFPPLASLVSPSLPVVLSRGRRRS